MINYKIKQDIDLIKDYQNNNNNYAKEELINRYKNYIEKITLKYSKKYSIIYEELIGYSYIGFLSAIKDYSYNIKTEFSRYVSARIYQYLDLAYIKLNIGCFMESDKLKIIKRCIKETEINNDTKLFNNPFMIDEIINKLINEPKLSEFKQYDLRNFIESQINTKSLNNIISYYDYNIPCINSVVREILKNAIDKLTEPYKTIVGYIYGFKDGKCYKLKEIAKMLNITINKVEYCKNKGLNMLLKNPEIKKLIGILNIYNETKKDTFEEKKLKKLR